MDENTQLLEETGPEGSARTTTGRHELHVTHLVMGVAFLGIVLLWLLGSLDLVPDADLRVLVPVPFLLAGGLGLLGIVLAQRRRR